MRTRTVSFTVYCVALVSLLASRAGSYQVPGQERVDYTAYTLRGGELSLGLLAAELGLTSEVMLGTYLPTWFAFPLLGAPIPTGFLKVRDPVHGWLALSGRVTLIYFSADALASDLVKNGQTDANLFIVPIDATVTSRVTPQFSQSLILTYSHVGLGANQSNDSTINGAVALSNLTLSTLLELRLTRVFAATLLARALLYQSPAHVRAHLSAGATQIDADLGLRPYYHGFTGCVIPGVAFSWLHANLEFGVGYGSWWIPVVQLPLSPAGIVPEGNLYVRF